MSTEIYILTTPSGRIAAIVAYKPDAFKFARSTTELFVWAIPFDVPVKIGDRVPSAAKPAVETPCICERAMLPAGKHCARCGGVG